MNKFWKIFLITFVIITILISYPIVTIYIQKWSCERKVREEERKIASGELKPSVSFPPGTIIEAPHILYNCDSEVYRFERNLYMLLHPCEITRYNNAQTGTDKRLM